MKTTARCLSILGWCALAGSGLAQTTIIDATFDGVANDTNNSFFHNRTRLFFLFTALCLCSEFLSLTNTQSLLDHFFR